MADADFTMLTGEQLVRRFLVNHVQHGRAYGGYLYVTSERLWFAPDLLPQERGAEPTGIALAEIANADVAPRGWGLRDAALRHRLRVNLSSGVVHYFVVSRPKDVADLVNGLLVVRERGRLPKLRATTSKQSHITTGGVGSTRLPSEAPR